MKKIGLVGIGLMGAPMARNWLAKGHSVCILPHKNKGRAIELQRSGAQVASDLKDLAQRADVIILMLPTSREVEKICLGAKGLQSYLNSSQIVIDMSTSDPQSTRKIHKAFQKKALRFFDAPVTGGVTGAENGSLTLFIGGPKEWFEEVRDTLCGVSHSQKHFGEIGNGHMAKIINNFICIGNLCVLSEALPLARKWSLDPTAIYETLLSGTASSEMLKFYGPQILQNDFRPRFKLAHALKDVALVKTNLKNLASNFPVLKGILQVFKKADSQGLGEENVSAIIKPLEDKLKAPFRA